MRNLFLLTALAATLSLAADTPGENPPGWAQLQLARISATRCDCIDDAWGLGLGIGRWTSSRWGWEASYLHARLHNREELWKASEDHLDGSALFRPFEDLGRWVPYLRGGIGFSRLQSPLSLSAQASTRLNVIAGVGTQIRFSDRSLGTMELRAMPIESSSRRTEFDAVVGYGYRWGSSPGAPMPLPPPPPPEPPTIATPDPAPAPTPAPVLPPAPAPVAPVVEQVVKARPMPRKIVLDEAVLHFPNNGDKLGAPAIQAITQVADQLKAYGGEYTLVVTGHTSSLGPRRHNLALSLRRAKSVAQALVDAGIPADRISTVGMGPDNPIADNRTKAGQSRNRRVEIDIQTPDAIQKTRSETGLVDDTAKVE